MLLWSAVFAAAAALVWGFARLSRIAAIGSAYRSKVLCSIVFGTNRSVDVQRVVDVSEDEYWLLRFFRSRVDPAAHSVTSSLFGLRRRTAVFRPGRGATLLLGNRLAILEPRTDAPSAERQVHLSDTSMRLNPRAMQAIDAAFSEPNPKRLRRTRAAVVMQDGQIVAERYAPDFDQSTRLPGWSVTKSVLNALVGILIGEGRLSLADTSLWPGWLPSDRRSAITLEDFLRMRSGLKFSEIYEDLSCDVNEMLFNQPDTAEYATNQPLIATPGTKWSYSSGTTNILSAIIRRVVGEAAYEDWPRRVLFDPLGMTSAILEPDASGTFVCSSFMLATARDWARFGQLFVQEGVWNGRRILPEGWVTFSTTPTPQSPGGQYGAHWWLKLKPEIGGGTPAAKRIPADAFFAVGHEGQIIAVVPSRRLVAVRLGLSIYIDAWNQAEFLAELLDAL